MKQPKKNPKCLKKPRKNPSVSGINPRTQDSIEKPKILGENPRSGNAGEKESEENIGADLGGIGARATPIVEKRMLFHQLLPPLAPNNISVAVPMFLTSLR